MFYTSSFICRTFTAFKLKKVNRNLLKIYLDMDLVFFDINFDNLNANFVYNEADFYDDKIKGVPIFLKLQKATKKSYEYVPTIDLSKLVKNQPYFIFTYKYLKTYSTKSVATVSCLYLSEIKRMIK